MWEPPETDDESPANDFEWKYTNEARESAREDFDRIIGGSSPCGIRAIDESDSSDSDVASRMGGLGEDCMSIASLPSNGSKRSRRSRRGGRNRRRAKPRAQSSLNKGNLNRLGDGKMIEKLKKEIEEQTKGSMESTVSVGAFRANCALIQFHADRIVDPKKGEGCGARY